MRPLVTQAPARPSPTDSSRVICLHCGLPIPPERRRRGDDFCCEGCSGVYALIRESGLERYYDLRGGAGVPAPALRPDGQAWFDRLLDPAEAAADTPVRLGLDLQGIHCAACVWLLGELFRRHPGAVDLRINPALGRADLCWIPSRFDLREYVREVERFGYRFGPHRRRGEGTGRGLLIRIAVCSAAAMNVMIFSIAFYAGLGEASAGSPALVPLFGWLSLALTGIAVAVGGSVFFRSALSALRRGVIHLDLPIALGILLAFAGSIWGAARHGPAGAYYDSVAGFVTLMLVGRWLQESVLERNRAGLLARDGIEALETRRLRNGRLAILPASAIEKGDEIWIVPGDLVPVASRSLSSLGTISLDWITGEPDAVPVSEGDGVPAGAFNTGSTTLRLSAEQDFADSRLNDLLAVVPDPAPGPASESLWRKLGTPYVLSVLLLAAAGYFLRLSFGVEAALRTAVSVLVVTCPCAIGLALPLAGSMIHLRLRRAGIFVRRGTFLERALRVRKIIFDKTGTLTRGRVSLTEASRRTLTDLAPEEREILLALAVRSNHPSSRMLTEALLGRQDAPQAEERGGRGTGVGEGIREAGAPGGGELVRDPCAPGGEGIREVAGQGMEWERPGERYRLGRASFACGPAFAQAPEAVGTCFTRNGVLLASFAFEDALKEDVLSEVRALRERGYAVHLLSGDAPEKVAAMARRLGLEEGVFAGGLSPEEKAARVRALDARDTMMVGDGINDALGFEAAFTTATPAVDRPALPGRADLYFLGDGIRAVRRALEEARLLRRVVRDNVGFALVYNLAALALCFAGWIRPVTAAVLMPASSLAVVLHTMARLRERNRWTS